MNDLSRKGPARHGGVRCSLARFIDYVWEYNRGYSTQLYSVKSTQIIIQTAYDMTMTMNMNMYDTLCLRLRYEVRYVQLG